MKTYKKVMSFGCSFTEGGGLNGTVFQNYLKGKIDTRREVPTDEHITFMKNNCYPAYLSQYLNCEFENYAESRSSNGLILKKLYENTSCIDDGTNILITIQTTLLSRIMLYIDKTSEYLTMNNLEEIPDNIRRYYKQYLTEFYNQEVEFKKLMQNIDVYTSYLQKKNFDVVWMLYETAYIPAESKTMMCFDDTDLSRYISDNNLRLADLPDYPEFDTHFSLNGNKKIADKIVEHLGKYYD